MKVVTDFPRRVRCVENLWIPMADGVQLAARMWLPEDATTNAVPAIIDCLPYRKRDGLKKDVAEARSQLLYAVLVPDGTRNSTVTYCGEKLSEPKPLEH